MEFNGHFYNPEYAGEGLFADEFDGLVQAAFFSYENGSQLWLICVGRREGASAILEAYKTSGGDIGNPVKLAQVEETLWGVITLTDRGDHITIRFVPEGENGWSYEAYLNGETGEPEPQNPVKLDLLIVGDTPIAQEVPLVHTIERNHKDIQTQKTISQKYRITGYTGKLFFAGSQEHNPSYREKGDIVELLLGPTTHNGQVTFSTHRFYTEADGVILDITTKVTKG